MILKFKCEKCNINIIYDTEFDAGQPECFLCGEKLVSGEKFNGDDDKIKIDWNNIN